MLSCERFTNVNSRFTDKKVSMGHTLFTGHFHGHGNRQRLTFYLYKIY